MSTFKYTHAAFTRSLPQDYEVFVCICHVNYISCFESNQPYHIIYHYQVSSKRFSNYQSLYC